MPNEAKAAVLQRTLDLKVLQTLATLGSMHGYTIAARIEQVSSGAIQLNMGTLYPGLLRLQKRGLPRRSAVMPARKGLEVYQHLSLAQVEDGYQEAVRGLDIGRAWRLRPTASPTRK